MARAAEGRQVPPLFISSTSTNASAINRWKRSTMSCTHNSLFITFSSARSKHTNVRTQNHDWLNKFTNRLSVILFAARMPLVVLKLSCVQPASAEVQCTGENAGQYSCATRRLGQAQMAACNGDPEPADEAQQQIDRTSNHRHI